MKVQIKDLWYFVNYDGSHYTVEGYFDEYSRNPMDTSRFEANVALESIFGSHIDVQLYKISENTWSSDSNIQLKEV